MSDDSAPVETAKLAAAGDWPRAETARTATPPEPAMIALGEFFELVNRPKAKGGAPSEGGEAATGSDSRIVAVDFSEGKAPLKYSNIAVSITEDAERGQVLQAQFGKVDQSWAGGFWSSFEPAAGLKADDCLGFGFTFKGDGTMPRECYLTLKAADGAAWRTANLNRLFESDEWREVLITPGEFELDPQWVKKNPDKAKAASPQPGWDALNRLDFVVIGPLMDQMSVAGFGGFYYAVKAGAEDSADASFRAGLPEPVVPGSPKIVIPPLADVEIITDGKPAEAEWKQALALSMDEDRVPDWHFFGSHVVDGKHLNGESANFWLLGTRGGLALLAEVHKGQPGVVAEKKEWYGNDCVELFSDPANQGGKPAKQIFLAYRRAGQNLPGASDGAIQIGRAKLPEGYVLEALIPWNALGFERQPTGEFGLEFQVDFAAKGQGRVLQMTYGTGTNEAWIKSERFLKATLKAVP